MLRSKSKQSSKNTFKLQEKKKKFHFPYKPSEYQKRSYTGLFHDATEIVARA